MSSSVGLWLVVILAVLAGLVIWRVLSGGRADADPAPTVEGAPVTATSDQEPPAAVVDEVSAPAAVTEEPAPVAQDAPAAAASPAGEARPAGEATAEPVTAAVEPVAAEATAAEPEPVAAEVEPAAAEVEPVGAGEEAAAPVVIPRPRTSVENAAPADADTPAAPIATPAATEAADDFRRIPGIGPKMAAALQAAGIRTYQQLSELDEIALRETIKAAGLRATPALPTWPQQAKVLAAARAEAEAALPAVPGGAA